MLGRAPWRFRRLGLNKSWQEEGMNTDRIKDIQEKATLVGTSGTVLLGFIYVSGYLVNSLYVRSRGIAPLPLLKAQYIETGLVFIILTGMLAAIPAIIAWMAIHGRIKHNQRVTPTIFIPILATTNFLLVILFWAIFVTEAEWEAKASLFGLFISVKRVFPIYLVTMLLVLPSLVVLRMGNFSQRVFLFIPKLDPNRENTLTSKPLSVFIQFLRLVAILATVAFDLVMLRGIAWLPGFCAMGSYYLVTVAFLIGASCLVVYLTGIYGDMHTRATVWGVGMPLLLACYYFCAIAYSYVIYNNIPVSRGGKLPTAKAVVDVGNSGSAKIPPEFYILEETENTVYVLPTTVANWFNSHEDVIAIPRSEIGIYRLVHIVSGEPRNNHLTRRQKVTP